MEVIEAVRTLLAVRQYTDRPVSEGDVTMVLEAGRLTGSAMNGQPWHFVVVRDEAMRAELSSRLSYSPYIADAPVAIGVFVGDNGGWGPMDGARAIQSMLLAAWGLGLGSTWTGSPRFEDIVRELLGVPEKYQFIGFITLGYPARSVGKGVKQRKPLSAIAHRERFGEPYTTE